MAFCIETKNLTYTFDRKRKAVDNLSLQVPEGSIFGFLGPNGAGKTTTIRLITGLLPNDADNVFIHNQSIRQAGPEIFRSIGCLIETPSLYGHLSAKENLQIICTLRSLPRHHIDRVLQIVRLHTVADKAVRRYSLGMKQRLAIAMALLPDPQLLILDEPVNGLDPNGMVEIRELLIRINREEGKTIFVSSHLLNEVERTCTHIAIINGGQLRYQGTLQEMKASAFAQGEVIFRITNADEWLAAIQSSFAQARKQAHDEVVFPVTDSTAVSSINQQLVSMNIPVTGIQLRGGLEEWFMHIISQDAKQLA